MSETERAVDVKTELLPQRSSFRPDEDVRVELRTASGAGTLTLLHLGEAVGRWEGIGRGVHSLGALSPGGYGIEWTDGTSAVRTAVRDGSTSLEADIGHEHTLRVHATRFIAPDGDTLVAVAAADMEELEDEFWDLITVFAVSLVGAVGVVAVGGYLLARKSTAPVERSFEHMRRFMADAAHELRTPVSFLRAHTEVALQQSRTAAEYAEALGEIGSELDRLGTVVNNLLTLARAESGERPVKRERFFLDDVALEAASNGHALLTLDRRACATYGRLAIEAVLISARDTPA